MGNLEEKCLRFVLHYYQKNKLDTQKALKDFKDKYRTFLVGIYRCCGRNIHSAFYAISIL